jgi:hypothetical protein
MASDELFLTVQPEPAKQGIRIDKTKYEAVHESILQNLQRYGSLTFTQLGALVEEDLRDTIASSILWYYTTVKLDMEAQGEIRRVPNSRPQLIEVVT